MEHQAIEITGKDGKTHLVWSQSAKDAYEAAAKWGYRHQGFSDVKLLIPRDNEEGCWTRAMRVPFGRQCSLELIVAKHTGITSCDCHACKFERGI